MQAMTNKTRKRTEKELLSALKIFLPVCILAAFWAQRKLA
jgi:hypothetical protein